MPPRPESNTAIGSSVRSMACPSFPRCSTECIYCTTFGALFKSGSDAPTAVQSMAPKGVMRRLMRAIPAPAVPSRPVA